MIYITAVHMEPSNGTTHEHIASLRWTEVGTSKAGDDTRAKVVAWINNGVEAQVTDGARTVRVGVVDGDPPYLRTYADGYPTDNLLSLPRY